MTVPDSPYAGRSSWIPESTCSWSDGKPCSREITLDADTFKKMVININLSCTAGKAYIWYRGVDDVWNSASFTYQFPGAYTLWMGGLSNWRGIITDVMIQPSTGCTNYLSPYKEYYINQVYFTP